MLFSNSRRSLREGVNLTPHPPLHFVERGRRAKRGGGEVQDKDLRPILLMRPAKQYNV